MAKVHAPRRPVPGFTLIELAIAMVIVALLAGAAWPHYTESVRRGRRADAVQAALQVQHAQERRLGNQGRYTAALDDLGLGASSAKGLYGLVLSSASATGYTLTLTAASDKSQAADAGCTTLTVVVVRGQPTLSPTACWSR